MIISPKKNFHFLRRVLEKAYWCYFKQNARKKLHSPRIWAWSVEFPIQCYSFESCVRTIFCNMLVL